MPNFALLTATGNDRPGIVAAITMALFEHGCNVEDSTMARLGGDFAIILILRLPESGDYQGLAATMEPIAAQCGLNLQLTESPEAQATGVVSSRPKYVIHVYGADQKGIVATVTRRLASQDVNITNLTTQVIPHANPLYVMMIEVELPKGVDGGQLTDDLRELGKEIGVQITMRPKEDARF